jgi:hypothetical protein
MLDVGAEVGSIDRFARSLEGYECTVERVSGPNSNARGRYRQCVIQHWCCMLCKTLQALSRSKKVIKSLSSCFGSKLL